MVLFAGLIFLILGLWLAVVSWPAILGALSLLLCLLGLLLFVVGYSERQARKIYAKVAQDETTGVADLESGQSGA